MEMKELTFLFCLFIYFFDTGFADGNGLLPSVPDPAASNFSMQGFQEYNSKFYVMTRIKPRSYCIVDKHSKTWATSPAPRELMLKSIQPKYSLGPEDITQWSIVFMVLAKDLASVPNITPGGS